MAGRRAGRLWKEAPLSDLSPSLGPAPLSSRHAGWQRQDGRTTEYPWGPRQAKKPFPSVEWNAYGRKLVGFL